MGSQMKSNYSDRITLDHDIDSIKKLKLSKFFVWKPITNIILPLEVVISIGKTTIDMYFWFVFRLFVEMRLIPLIIYIKKSVSPFKLTKLWLIGFKLRDFDSFSKPKTWKSISKWINFVQFNKKLLERSDYKKINHWFY